MFCPHCGNSVEANDTFCNKCGQRVNDAPQAAEAVAAAPVADAAVQQPVQPVAPVAAENEGKSNGVAIAALIVSLAGPLLFPFIANIVGLILGIVGVKKSADRGGKGKGLGIASIVISVLGIIFWVICTALVFVWLMSLMEEGVVMLPMFML